MNYSLPEFLAHAVALEREAEERYTELAEMMEAHANRDTAKVFREMARFSKLHAHEISNRTKNLEIAKLKSWEFRWRLPPEVGDYAQDGTDYLMTPLHALTYARANEVRGMEFYRTAAEHAQNEDVRRFASRCADEEEEHVAALDRWIADNSSP